MSYVFRLPTPEISHPELKFILQGVKRSKPRVEGGSKPVRWSHLKRIYNHLYLVKPIYCQFWTACLLMFRALLHISHIIESDHTLFWSDVKFKEWGVLLCVRSAKCRYAGIHEIPIASITDKRFCIVHWLRRLFMSKQREVVFPLLSYSNFRSMLHVSLLRSRLHVHLTTHSFRRGGASFLASVGVPMNQIKSRGGWKSDCVKKYISEPCSVHIKRELLVSKNFV